MADASFEVKFSQLAENQLKEKVPVLMKYRAGFQVIDKDDDGTEAVGLMAFVINSTILYMPVIFKKGVLKGTDILYIRENDIMIPARDNWITSLKTKGSDLLGKGVDFSTTDSSLRNAASADDVQLDQGSPVNGIGKSGSEDLFPPYIIEKMKVRKGTETSFSFIEKLAEAGPTAQEAFFNTFRQNTDYVNAMLSVYDTEDLQKLASVIKDISKQTVEEEKPKVKIISSISDPQAKSLAENDKKQLIRNGLFVVDTRKETSKVFRDVVDPKVTTQPSETGVYDVLQSDGNYKKALLLFVTDDFPDLSTCSASCGNGTAVYRKVQDVLVIPEGESQFCTTPRDKIFVKSGTAEKIDTFGNKGISFSDWVKDGKRDVSGKFASDSTGRAVVVGSQGESYVVRAHSPSLVNGNLNFTSYDGVPFSVERINVSSIKRFANVLYIPEDAQIYMEKGYSKPAKISFGSPQIIMSKFYKEASLQPLAVHSRNGLSEITCFNQSSGLLQKTAAIRYLTEKLGVQGGQAQFLLNEASRSISGKVGFNIKLAAAYETVMNNMVAAGARKENAVTETSNTVGGRESTMPEDLINKATKAAETGIKEVFDAASIKALLSVADLSELRKGYLADIIRGMDRIGRMLFLFYWHTEEFEDRYGKDDMDKLEDTLRQMFVGNGDLVLFLKEKTAYSPEYAESLMGSLSEGVGEASQTATE